jgi:hypothetical protein
VPRPETHDVVHRAREREIRDIEGLGINFTVHDEIVEEPETGRDHVGS